MTPLQIENQARARYNAVGDSFFTSDEINNLIYQAQMELVLEGLVVERRYTTTSVVDQQEYSYPSQALSIKRIEYAGEKLTPIDFREDDRLTLFKSNTTDTGTPRNYFEWDEVIFLRPIPDTSGDTIKIYTYSEPQVVTSTSTLDVAERWHLAIIDYILNAFNAKDGNFAGAQFYLERWQAALVKAKKFAKQRKRGDRNAVVNNVEAFPRTVLGVINA